MTRPLPLLPVSSATCGCTCALKQNAKRQPLDAESHLTQHFFRMADKFWEFHNSFHWRTFSKDCRKQSVCFQWLFQPRGGITTACAGRQAAAAWLAKK